MLNYNKEEIFSLFLAGKCSPEQAQWLISKFAEEDFRQSLEAYVQQELEIGNQEALEGFHELSEREYEKIALQLFPSKREKTMRLIPKHWSWIAAAASILLILGLSIYLHKDVPAPAAEEQLATIQQHIPSQQEGITLTLPHGEVVPMEAAQAQEKHYQPIENKDIPSYVIKKSISGKIPYPQEITVPKEKTALICLTDGTKVWLNANSSLRYDANFVGTERQVTLYGEAYFEVAKQADKPFIVKSGNQQIQVLGTHFNVEAYSVNCNKTTLMEGSIRLQTSKMQKLLKPGQQVLSNAAGDLKQQTADLQQVESWRKHTFVFQDAKLTQIAQELTRWYGVQVQVDPAIAQQKFSGNISRKQALEDLLAILQRTGQIHYKINYKNQERSVQLTK
ncbi:FecR family protein [Sphingobacterium humi]|uniref:DUF4974 domain-containing protein n=1 Tax=Sphingobacterium humi TaxID=1796905 RepID=A0A6N8L3S1_9SPHI|nr:FecR domain-containing protein [Sphingobacterium humi]MVZ63091.1 DUF4974 domain-containing protein [Sphingobacterium humi]